MAKVHSTLSVLDPYPKASELFLLPDPSMDPYYFRSDSDLTTHVHCADKKCCHKNDCVSL